VYKSQDIRAVVASSIMNCSEQQYNDYCRHQLSRKRYNKGKNKQKVMFLDFKQTFLSCMY